MLTTLKKISLFTGTLTALAVPSFAAEAGRSNPTEPLVWGFLGLCALIIIAQVAPLIFNLKKQAKSTVEHTKEVKHQPL